MKKTDVPTVTITQMREVDRMMVHEVGVSIRQMMENASSNIARVCKRMMNELVIRKNITILCGKGNNGGDGLGAARHLINMGAEVHIILAVDPHTLSPDALAQYKALAYQKAHLLFADEALSNISLFQQTDYIIDALLGYNLRGNPREPFASLIQKANESQKPILAVDMPSGMNGDDGSVMNPVIKAAATVTLALPKVGLYADKARPYVGALYLADLSVPKQVYAELGIQFPLLFSSDSVIKLI